MPRLAIALLLPLLVVPGIAAAQEDPRCGVELRRAWDLVEAVAKRDRGEPYGPQALCEALRANLRDMRESTDIMRRCMKGHALRENVGQMDASMEDVAAAIASRCR